jgi:ABC-2 type transport system ATP-binding protein
MIIADGLCKQFGQRRAVDHVSLRIEKGETFGLLGPNGAGKTTMISMLVGLLMPDAGFAKVADLDPTTAPARLRLGVAPQSLSLYDDLSAAENLRFFGQIYGLSGGHLQQRLEWALDFAGLRERQRDRVRTFSGGMKRRLNIAVALIHEPQVLLLDEPTVGVDPQSRNHMLDGVQKLADEGLTIVYTTHYMEEAQRLCSRVAIMDQGRLLALDTVPELIRQHGGRSVVQGRLVEGSSTDSLPGTVENGTIRFESTSPIEDLARLHARGVEFYELNISQPDLESVFLTLTGRSLRD